MRTTSSPKRLARGNSHHILLSQGTSTGAIFVPVGFARDAKVHQAVRGCFRQQTRELYEKRT
jgi:hypothetical protein